MAAKEVKFSVDARNKMLHGIEILTHAVRVTLGPKAEMSYSISPSVHLGSARMV